MGLMLLLPLSLLAQTVEVDRTPTAAPISRICSRDSSRSRMMREQVGRWIPAGIAEGISRYGALVDNAMDGLANGMTAGRVQVALEGGTGMRGINSGYDQMTEGFAGFDSMMEDNLETQNALLREQNGLLTRILERTGGGQGVSAGFGRTVTQSVEMYNRIGG